MNERSIKKCFHHSNDDFYFEACLQHVRHGVEVREDYPTYSDLRERLTALFIGHTDCQVKKSNMAEFGFGKKKYASKVWPSIYLEYFGLTSSSQNIQLMNMPNFGQIEISKWHKYGWFKHLVNKLQALKNKKSFEDIQPKCLGFLYT